MLRLPTALVLTHLNTLIDFITLGGCYMILFDYIITTIFIIKWCGDIYECFIKYLHFCYFSDMLVLLIC